MDEDLFFCGGDADRGFEDTANYSWSRAGDTRNEWSADWGERLRGKHVERYEGWRAAARGHVGCRAPA